MCSSDDSAWGMILGANIGSLDHEIVQETEVGRKCGTLLSVEIIWVLVFFCHCWAVKLDFGFDT